MIEQIIEAVEFIRGRGVDRPEIGIVLGTGLGNLFVKQIENPVVIEYHDIPHFPVSTVEFHKGRLIAGVIQGKKVLAMQGRFHYYEGYSMQQITFPIRVMKLLGVKHLLLSNAAGNMNLDWKKGDLMLLDDHIHFQPDNPLRGINDETLGPRFPDMSQPYAKYLNTLLIDIAREKDIKLHVGVYISVMGPNLETRAEYRFLRRMGADAVGMSTVPEVIVANHMGLPCCAISVLTDDCDPDNLKPVNISDIIAIAGQSENKLTDLYIELIRQL
ncbi:purine-nucleoside phosphorylase [Ohtaekwangia sp.]|uniref:purine-nucleoside phosphorylase n=1 Tax=Ohtaekwangia sp. TaxID=2066019 RepID=UPI002F95AE6D